MVKSNSPVDSNWGSYFDKPPIDGSDFFPEGRVDLVSRDLEVMVIGFDGGL